MTPLPTNPRALWAQSLRQRSVWARAVRLGLSVGFLQAVVNQGDHWFSGAVDRTVLLKSIISPLIGFTLVLALFGRYLWRYRNRQGLSPEDRYSPRRGR